MAYDEILPDLPRATLTDNLKKSLSARWKEHPDVVWWKDYFEMVSTSDYLTGKVNGWNATLSWLTGPQNMSKVLNGNYINRCQANQLQGVVSEKTQRTIENLKDWSPKK